MECGEVDLRTYLNDLNANNTTVDINIIRLLWQQMLMAVSVIHSHNVIHSDLKPGNFLFVKSQLKLIDFGIARTMSADATSLIREDFMGTVNYMAPEALVDIAGKKDKHERKVGDDEIEVLWVEIGLLNLLNLLLFMNRFAGRRISGR